MTVQLSLQTIQEADGYSLLFILPGDNASSEEILKVTPPVTVETFAPNATKSVASINYESVNLTSDSITGQKAIVTRDGQRYRLIDFWRRVEPDTWQVDRQLEVENAVRGLGVGLRLDVITAFREGTRYDDLKYFAPPMMYNHNDLDGDGIDDYYQTRNLVYREDKLNLRAVMAYHALRGLCLTLIRADRPEFEPLPERPNKERVFLWKTDVGALGYWNLNGRLPQVSLRAHYPFYEGERSHALLVRERPAWQAFFPAVTGETLKVSYQVRVERAPTFLDAIWSTFSRILRDFAPTPVALTASHEEIIRLRLEALNRYYIERDAAQDPNEPAGFVLNCHPQDGKQLSNMIEYGFTGINVINAYNVMRYGYENNIPEYVRRGVRTTDFFARKAHIRDSGMFYDLYNVDRGIMQSWWTGLLLPLAYAQEGADLEKLMGPVYHHRQQVIESLRSVHGSYLRAMSEDAFGLLLAYELELKHGHTHPEWLESAVRYGEFLLRAQEPDGSWYRAYSADGKPMRNPPMWFGTTIYQTKSQSATPIPFLVKLAEITGDRRYLDAACNAGRFHRTTFIDPVRFNGGILDSIFTQGMLIDNEGIAFPLFGQLALYRAVGGDFFRQGAINAARLYATYAYLWDVPMAPGCTLDRFGFRSTGMGAADMAGGYTHSWEINGVADLVEVALMTNDETLFNSAELFYQASNQTVSVPGKDWGLRYHGLQEEGAFSSWWALDDPMFQETGFGHRWKGEGNKTCLPWIPGTAVFNYWKMHDRFGTVDFAELRKRLHSGEQAASSTPERA
ncbi:MAG TPA: hypothetical protein VFD70_28710 [Anaerolineae bacterium]|nr:hypothetical protein [Anaerolineae bacterium]